MWYICTSVFCWQRTTRYKWTDQKSLGVPIQVRGVKMAATKTIHRHRVKLMSAQVVKIERKRSAISTMKTQPPPYSVRLMHTRDSTLEQR